MTISNKIPDSGRAPKNSTESIRTRFTIGTASATAGAHPIKPHDPISPKKLGWMHKLFAKIGKEAIEALTGQPSTKLLSEVQAWEFLDGSGGSADDHAAPY